MDAFSAMPVSASSPAPAESAPANAALSDARPALLDAIGNTPLLPLHQIGRNLPEGVTLWAKAEHLNPGGSVKDRPARHMIEAGLRTGAYQPHHTLIDATSGNTGIAYAMIAAALGRKVALALPENASAERKAVLRAYGAELILTDPMEGTDGAQDHVHKLVDAHPDRYFYPDQYSNDANWQAHYDTTAPEIWDQTNERITHFVAGLGTTGTFTGVARRLKEYDEALTCVAMQPDTALHGLEGLKHLPSAHTPAIYDNQLADAHVTCSTETAHAMTKRLAAEEGLLVGPSAGANVATALRHAQTLTTGHVVTILCDTGTRYLSGDLWSDNA
jgi:cysteine synthase B